MACIVELVDPLAPLKPILKECYNWQAVRKNIEDFIMINSDNDPWDCGDLQGRQIFDNVGRTQIIRHGDSHVGSNDYNQPYLEFPFLLKLID